MEKKNNIVLPYWFKSAFSIGLACIPAELLTLPLNTLKINYAASVIKNINQKHIIYPIKLNIMAINIYKSRGIYGFFNSSPMAITSQIFSATSKYTIYECLKKHFGTTQNNLLLNILMGSFAGITGAFIVQPIDQVKILRQYDDGKPTKSYRSIFKQFLIKPSSAWRGYPASFSKNIVLYGLLYPFYDRAKNVFNNNILISAIVTTLITSTITQPIEFIRTRIMTGYEWKLGWSPKVYYTGYTLTAGRAIPHFAITMYFTEFLKKHIE